MKPAIIGVSVLYVLVLGIGFIRAQNVGSAQERPQLLRSEGTLADWGTVSVFYPSDSPTHKFGEITYADSFTGPALIFHSRWLGREDKTDLPIRFSMNIEFLREIVQIADAERAKQSGVRHGQKQ